MAVRCFIAGRRYGFIRRDAGGRDVFFQRSAAEGATDADLSPGRRVRVAVEDNASGRPQVVRLMLG